MGAGAPPGRPARLVVKPRVAILIQVIVSAALLWALAWRFPIADAAIVKSALCRDSENYSLPPGPTVICDWLLVKPTIEVGKLGSSTMVPVLGSIFPSALLFGSVNQTRGPIPWS